MLARRKRWQDGSLQVKDYAVVWKATLLLAGDCVILISCVLPAELFWHTARASLCSRRYTDVNLLNYNMHND